MGREAAVTVTAYHHVLLSTVLPVLSALLPLGVAAAKPVPAWTDTGSSWRQSTRLTCRLAPTQRYAIRRIASGPPAATLGAVSWCPPLVKDLPAGHGSLSAPAGVARSGHPCAL